jgi:hypothetical protein
VVLWALGRRALAVPSRTSDRDSLPRFIFTPPCAGYAQSVGQKK